MGKKGIGGSKKGRRLSETTRHRMSLAHKGKKLAPTHVANISQSLKGRRGGKVLVMLRGDYCVTSAIGHSEDSRILPQCSKPRFNI